VLHRYNRNQRLLTARDFDRVFSKPAARVSSKYLLLLARPADGDCSRLGLVMSKKNVGNAVRRNRIKRLCREYFRLHAAELPPTDLVLLARPGISEVDNAGVRALLEELFSRLQARDAAHKRTDAH
jgi:ribonuclease P protein component